MRDYLRLMIVLALISGIAAGTLVAVNVFTEPKILAAKVQAEALAYQKALAQADSFVDDQEMLDKAQSNPDLAGILAVKQGLKDGNPVGWVCKVATTGYGGNIELLVGLGIDGQLERLLVLSQTETPGLGANITTDKFIAQPALYGSKNQNFKLTKDGGKVQAVTGATISSRAVLNGVNQVFELYNLVKSEG